MQHPLLRLGTVLLLGLLAAGCGRPAAHTAHAGGSGANAARAQGRVGTVPITQWTCSSRQPPVPGGTGVITRSEQALGSITWQVVADPQTGCLVSYRAAGSLPWTRTLIAGTLPGGVANIDLEFVNARDGWVLAPGFPAAGQVTWELYHTTDSGLSWMHQPAARSTPFPSTDVNLQMSFTSAGSGWLSVLSGFYTPPRVFLYHTINGGDSWTVRSFPVPAKYGPDLQFASPPLFSSPRVGTLTVAGDVAGSARMTLTYRTRDGGSIWTLQQVR